MPWFAAHVIMRVRFLEGAQEPVTVWENCVLVRANDRREAREKAGRTAHAEAAVSDDAMTWQGRQAQFEFLGVRKTLEIDGAELTDGVELTYSEFVVKGEREAVALAAGEAVDVTYEE